MSSEFMPLSLDTRYGASTYAASESSAAMSKEELEKLGFTVLPSQSNFLFARKPGTEGADVYRRLKEWGVLVRHFDKERIQDYNRITIGTREQMDILLEKLREFL